MKTAMPVPSKDKTVDYKVVYTGRQEEPKYEKNLRGATNPITWQFMKNRYVVLKDFLPKDMITFSMDIWKSHEFLGTDTEIEDRDITYKNPKDSIGKSAGKYCSPWGIALSHYIHNKLEDYMDMNLVETYSYTRKYHRGAYLGSHTDRPSCEVSATLCLDYKTDDQTPWTIWLRNDKNYGGVDAEIVKNESQDLNHRERLKNGCIPVNLEPGDILLYQGPNIPHWRDRFLGDYSYHLFTHFVNRDSHMNAIPDFYYGNADTQVSLQLDGREHRWSDDNSPDIPTEQSEMANSFNDKYYASDYGCMVNDYDDLQLIENKKK